MSGAGRTRSASRDGGRLSKLWQCVARQPDDPHHEEEFVSISPGLRSTPLVPPHPEELARAKTQKNVLGSCGHRRYWRNGMTATRASRHARPEQCRGWSMRLGCVADIILPSRTVPVAASHYREQVDTPGCLA